MNSSVIDCDVIFSLMRIIYKISIYLLVLVRVDRVPNSRTLKILYGNNTPPSTSRVNSDITIVFPAPKLVYTDIYMVGVPCF